MALLSIASRTNDRALADLRGYVLKAEVPRYVLNYVVAERLEEDPHELVSWVNQIWWLSGVREESVLARRIRPPRRAVTQMEQVIAAAGEFCGQTPGESER